MSTAILSPHLDDAVLSCWHVLEGRGDVVVVNVFTGSPADGTPPPPWDRLTGAADPVARMAERRAEDVRALGLVGREAVNLELLDAQYRASDPRVDELVERLRGVLQPGTVVHAPAALAGHPDHELVRDAAIELARQGWPLVIYADLPHAIARGWPAWVAGVPAAPGVDVGGEWADVLAATALDVPRLVPRVRPLDARARARKLRALAEYRTQRRALDDMAFVALEDPRALAYEVAWRVPDSALGARHEPRGRLGVTDARRQPLHDAG